MWSWGVRSGRDESGRASDRVNVCAKRATEVALGGPIMRHNPIIDTLLDHKSIRRYDDEQFTDYRPSRRHGH